MSRKIGTFLFVTSCTVLGWAGIAMAGSNWE